MTAVPHRVKGWCPGALRPMATGDGLIVRLRVSGGILPAALLAEIARLAETYGNGLVDQSQRANLQIRGVTEAGWPDLIAALSELGLIDADPEAEAIRNVIASPLAGLDATAPVDGRVLAAGLEAGLAADPALKALPGKFGFLVDEGGAVALDGVETDIRLVGLPDGRVRLDLGGREGPVTPASRAVAAALAAASVYLAFRRPEERRLAALVGRMGIADFAAALPAGAPMAGAAPERRPGEPVRPGPGRIAGLDCLVAAAPFGRWDARQLAALAAIAARHGGGEARLTPWRMMILPGVAAPAGLAAARAAGAIVDAADPRLAVVACAGAPDCKSGLVPARPDAERLAAAAAALPGGGVRLHVSGCPKGCARPEAAAVTLVGRGLDGAGGGLYDLILDGPAGGEPAARGLSTKDALARLAGLAEKRAMISSPPAPGPATRETYVRDGQAIYDRSFAIIRAEADLARFAADEEKVAVRIVHACGMVEVAADIAFAPGAVAAAKAALAAGAPILCDAKMVANGITRARLPAGNEVVCTLDDPRVPDLARRIDNTRTAAAMELWRDRLAGSVVAIGNAPTALFRLLELLDEGLAPPAAVIGMPVGFVGAAESKEALMADGRVPWLVVRGRKGGSAMTAAAVNAVASERE